MTLREWRKKRGVTAEELAKRSGISVVTVRSYETGARRPRLNVAERLEAATNSEVSAASLMGLENTPTSTRRKRVMREDAAPFIAAEKAAVTVNIPINPQLLADLREMKVDVAAVVRKAAAQGLEEAYRTAFREANKEAIESTRRYIEKYGTFAEQMGLI